MSNWQGDRAQKLFFLQRENARAMWNPWEPRDPSETVSFVSCRLDLFSVSLRHPREDSGSDGTAESADATLVVAGLDK